MQMEEKEQKIIALERELESLDEAEYYTVRATHIGFKKMKDSILNKLKEIRSSTD